VIGIAIYYLVICYCSDNPVKHSIRELPSNVLPARRHVDQHIRFLNEIKFCSNKDIVPHVAQIFTDLWNRASMPAQPLKNVKAKLVSFMAEVSAACECGKQATKTKNFKGSYL